jgi:hypothetical protein
MRFESGCKACGKDCVNDEEKALIAKIRAIPEAQVEYYPCIKYHSAYRNDIHNGWYGDWQGVDFLRRVIEGR